MNWLERRRLRKTARHLVREARHLRNLRGDVAEPGDLAALERAVAGIRAAGADAGAFERAADDYAAAALRVYPRRPFARLREYVEIILVAGTVALACRSYFVLPFRIPTSSMSPTLAGIHFEPCAGRGLFDMPVLNLAKWLVFGSMYREIRSPDSGVADCRRMANGSLCLALNGRLVRQPMDGDVTLRFSPGDSVVRGQLLATAQEYYGDHIFVNRMAWNFRKPRRGEIMVFKTHGINHPDIHKNEHYVKRLVGLPGETVAIRPPDLLIGGERVSEPDSIVRIEDRRAPYSWGYMLPGPGAVRPFLGGEGGPRTMATNEYFACGDNQPNSADSRYWGPVREQYLVGPVFMIHWPLSRRWGAVK